MGILNKLSNRGSFVVIQNSQKQTKNKEHRRREGFREEEKEELSSQGNMAMAAIFRSAAKKKKCLQVMSSCSLMREEKKHLHVHTTQTFASSSILCSKISRSFGLPPSSSSPTTRELKVNQFLPKGTYILSFFDFHLYSQKTKILLILLFFLLKLLSKINQFSYLH